MGPIEEFEYGASLEYYARRHILMVKRNGGTPVSLPGAPCRGLHHHPGTPAGVVAWAPQSLLLLDNATPPEPFLQDATGS